MRKARPICGDPFAERFMDAEARAIFKRFKKFRGPNASNAARHRIIDDWLRLRLSDQPKLRIVLLGAGFDTRAFRLSGGEWLEIERPEIVSRKEDLLPAHQAPNSLQRIAMEFERERLADKLAAWSDSSAVVVVLEGVSMYLAPAVLRETLGTLVRLLPGHTLICDLMTQRFARRYGVRLVRRIEELGGTFAQLLDDPAEFIADLGYRLVSRESIPRRAVSHGSVLVPLWLLNTLFRSLRDGYQVYVFEAPVVRLSLRSHRERSNCAPNRLGNVACSVPQEQDAPPRPRSHQRRAATGCWRWRERSGLGGGRGLRP